MFTADENSGFGAKSSTCSVTVQSRSHKIPHMLHISIDLSDLVVKEAFHKQSKSLVLCNNDGCVNGLRKKFMKKIFPMMIEQSTLFEATICFCFFYDFICIMHRMDR